VDASLAIEAPLPRWTTSSSHRTHSAEASQSEFGVLGRWSCPAHLSRAVPVWPFDIPRGDDPEAAAAVTGTCRAALTGEVPS